MDSSCFVHAPWDIFLLLFIARRFAVLSLWYGGDMFIFIEMRLCWDHIPKKSMMNLRIKYLVAEGFSIIKEKMKSRFDLMDSIGGYCKGNDATWWIMTRHYLKHHHTFLLRCHCLFQSINMLFTWTVLEFITFTFIHKTRNEHNCRIYCCSIIIQLCIIFLFTGFDINQIDVICREFY